MASRNLAWRLAAPALALVVAACAGKDRPAAASADAPRTGGTAVVAIHTDIDYANSLVTADKWAQEVNRFVLFLPLVQYGPGLDYEPRLAERWQLLGDTAAVFHLRPDVRWADGVPVRAADVVFTYRRAVDTLTAFPNAEYFTYWRGVEAPDSLTVVFHFLPHADPLAGLPFLPIMPAHLLDSIPPERMRQAAFNHRPVGDGPFRFVEYRANDRWVFEANPDFPEGLGGRPRLDRLVLRIIPEPTAEVTALLTGDVDLTTAAGARAYQDLADRPDIRRTARPTMQLAAIVWNGRRPALRDARVRLALAYAMDRQTLLDALRGGMGRLATGPIVPEHWAYARDLRPLPYAPDSARALLAAAGYQDHNGDGVLEDRAGRPLELTITIPASSSTNRNLAEMLQAQLGRVGVRLRVLAVDAGVFREDIESPERRFDAVPLVYGGDLRLSFRDQFHSASIGKPFQLASYANPVVDSVIDRAPLVTDRAEAAALWHRFQEVLLREQPWTFLWYAPELVMERSSLRGTDMDVRGTLVNVARWWLLPAGAETAER
jgi:peptide/nickel transport system substrate-binding protein